MSTYLIDMKYCPVCGGQRLEDVGTVFIEGGNGQERQRLTLRASGGYRFLTEASATT